jgi:hypothetical protein
MKRSAVGTVIRPLIDFKLRQSCSEREKNELFEAGLMEPFEAMRRFEDCGRNNEVSQTFTPMAVEVGQTKINQRLVHATSDFQHVWLHQEKPPFVIWWNSPELRRI